MEVSTKERLIEAGLTMLLQHGYTNLGIQQLLAETEVPKGSFYHHFETKEDFALQVIDRYMANAHAVLDLTLRDETHPPLQRVRRFFDTIQDRSYRRDGYLGCLIGGLGQELSGISTVFRRRIEKCFQEIAGRIAGTLQEAIDRGELARDADARELANRLVDCWQGAALRSRLLRDPEPMNAMLDFYFQSMAAPKPPTRRQVTGSRKAHVRPEARSRSRVRRS